MRGRNYKAITIVAPDFSSHTALEEAFNAWAAQEQPAAILHVHYYHDPSLRVRGYQVIYEESQLHTHAQAPAELALNPSLNG